MSNEFIAIVGLIWLCGATITFTTLMTSAHIIAKKMAEQNPEEFSPEVALTSILRFIGLAMFGWPVVMGFFITDVMTATQHTYYMLRSSALVARQTTEPPGP